MIKKFAAFLMCFSLGVIAVSGCSKEEDAKTPPADAKADAPADAKADAPADPPAEE